MLFILVPAAAANDDDVEYLNLFYIGLDLLCTGPGANFPVLAPLGRHAVN